jgi:hypothetical protein
MLRVGISRTLINPSPQYSKEGMFMIQAGGWLNRFGDAWHKRGFLEA